MRTAELAHQSPHQLALGGGHEVELPSLGRRSEIAGFAVSIDGGIEMGL
jgi:hypothetical protein